MSTTPPNLSSNDEDPRYINSSLVVTPSDGVNVLDLLIVLAHRKEVVLRATLGVTVLAVGVSLLLPNTYTATTKILPPQQNQSLASTLSGQLGALGSLSSATQSLGLKNSNEVYVTMLKSRTVEDALINRFDLVNVYREKRISDARRRLEAASQIELGGKDNVISISVEDKDGRRAAELANTYVEELRKLTQRHAVTEAAGRRLFFEQQLDQTRSKLDEAEQALKLTQQRTGVIQLDSQANAIIESLVKQKAQLAVKEVQLQAMRSFATPQNPDVLLAEQQLASMRSQIATLEKQGGGEGDIQVATGKVPEVGLEYVRKVRDIKYYETIFGLLARQLEAAKLDESKSAAVIQVLDPAITPDRKSSPKRSLLVVFAGLLGFLCSALYVLVSEALSKMCSEPEVNARLLMLRAALAKRPS